METAGISVTDAVAMAKSPSEFSARSDTGSLLYLSDSLFYPAPKYSPDYLNRNFFIGTKSGNRNLHKLYPGLSIVCIGLLDCGRNESVL
jgi:hypothetical protein